MNGVLLPGLALVSGRSVDDIMGWLEGHSIRVDSLREREDPQYFRDTLIELPPGAYFAFEQLVGRAYPEYVETAAYRVNTDFDWTVAHGPLWFDHGKLLERTTIRAKYLITD